MNIGEVETGLVVPFAPAPDPARFAFSGDVIHSDEFTALRAVVEGTARSTGEDFFRSLVTQLARAMDVDFAFVCEFAEANARVRTLAFYERGRIVPNIEFNIRGTPCQDVISGNLCHYPSGVADAFPEDVALKLKGLQSYLGVPLLDDDRGVLGHLAIFNDRPMPAEPRRLFIFHIFAARAAAELERLRAEQRLAESERRYRDLYDHAPVGNLSIGVDGRFLSVSDRAAEWLGYNVDELVGQHITTVFNDSPAGTQRGLDCFRRFAAGEEVSDVELELRAKNGRSVWVKLYVRPVFDPQGNVVSSRSVWVNITDRIEAEREQIRLQRQNVYLQDELKSAHNFDQIIGRSSALRQVLENVRRVAVTDSTVLITGETGTGKELIARAIHLHSRRRDKPLIKLNCAALPSGLIESELFGHEKGAFTGALARKTGRFELADGGTIFLDEIGELPAEAQAKLLRVLQEQEFERVGGVSSIKVNVRVIAATNRDLKREVAERNFREDLYFRLNVFPIPLPPLRERVEDIPLLVAHLVEQCSTRVGRPIDGIHPDSLRRLERYGWPGNVRELQNIVERAVILGVGPLLEIGPDVLPLGADGAAEPAAPKSDEPGELRSVERRHILDVLEQTGWVIDGRKGAARILGLHPNTLRSRMKKLSIVRGS